MVWNSTPKQLTVSGQLQENLRHPANMAYAVTSITYLVTAPPPFLVPSNNNITFISQYPNSEHCLYVESPNRWCTDDELRHTLETFTQSGKHGLAHKGRRLCNLPVATGKSLNAVRAQTFSRKHSNRMCPRGNTIFGQFLMIQLSFVLLFYNIENIWISVFNANFFTASAQVILFLLSPRMRNFSILIDQVICEPLPQNTGYAILNPLEENHTNLVTTRIALSKIPWRNSS